MYVLSRKWEGGYLDYFRAENEYRIKVVCMGNIFKLSNLYFERPRNIRYIIDYVFDVGIANTIYKILSRLREEKRNDKYVSVGIGRVLERPKNGKYSLGELVAFTAIGFPVCAERIVLDGQYVFKNKFNCNNLNEKIVYYYGKLSHDDINEINYINTYNRFSGYLSTDDMLYKFEWLTNKMLEKMLSFKHKEEYLSGSTIRENNCKRLQHSKSRSYKKKKSAVVFGFGNYAKTMILPTISKKFNIKCIHEIDPMQMNLSYKNKLCWDSSDRLRENENYDVYFIASYHHTHANLAISALDNNGYAVVEKPIVTTYSQLNLLKRAVAKVGQKIFSCFHRRYNIFNEYIYKDMEIEKGDPVDYHCIVYEEPLPPGHWYSWPNSGSRILSNGCHWIDHFLYLNKFSRPAKMGLYKRDGNSIVCFIRLRNNAFFTMSLGEVGSYKLGVKDYVELRSKFSTAIIVNNCYYKSFNKLKTVNKRKVHKYFAHHNMYRTISKRINNNLSGDSIDSIIISSLAILDMEKLYNGNCEDSNDPTFK